MNSNSSSGNYIMTSDYNSELKNNSYINNYENEEQEEEKKYCSWSHEEEQIFQNALAEMDPNSPTFYQDLASRIPWKYIQEIKQHYRELTGETDSSCEEKRPVITQRIISTPPQEVINENDVVSAPHKSRKNVPWTEEEHQLFLMGLEVYGKGRWKFISEFFVQTRTPVQVASHAQKFFAHHRNLDKSNCSKEPPPRQVNKARRHSIFDNTDPFFLPDSQEPAYSYPPPPPLLPPPNDYDETGFLDSIVSFPGIGNITDDDHQYYNPSSSSSAGSINGD